MASPPTNTSDVSPPETSDDPSAPTEVCREDAIDSPHPTASTWFTLTKRDGNITAECWSYFQVINNVIDDSKLHSEWLGTPDLAGCNLCGKVSSYSSRVGKTDKYKMTNSKLDAHLTSHGIYFGK